MNGDPDFNNLSQLANISLSSSTDYFVVASSYESGATPDSVPTLYDIEVTAVPFEFSPGLGILLVGAGLGLKRGRNYLQASRKKIDLA